MTASLPAGLLLAGLVLPSIALCAQSTAAPDPSEIIKRSVAANAADWKALPEYSFCARSRKCKVDTSGHVKVEEAKTYQTTMIEGSPYERVIAIDNQPLDPEQQRQEQAKFDREVARRQNESSSQRQARLSKYHSERAEERMLMQQMAEAFTFTLAGEQQIDGIDCYVLNASPKPDYRPPVQKARVLLGTKGRLWIDKEHYHWVKVQAEVVNPVEFGGFVAKVKPGTKFELQQEQVGDVWLPKHFSESVNASVFGLYGLRSTEEADFSDYRSTVLATKASKPAAAASGTNGLARPLTATELAAR
jgi:hypothetical protein